MKEKQIFANFVALQSDDKDRVLTLFQKYYDLLLEANKRVNLISRKTEPSTIWTHHFYDSLLPLAYDIDFSKKKVLDLGTGGGMPGIPLAIMKPDMEIHLLDSIAKKVTEVTKIIKKLDLVNCSAIRGRLEEKTLDTVKDIGEYDIIVSRSVLMTDVLLKKAMTKLKNEGFLLLYKAKTIEKDLLKLNIQILDSIILPWRERKLIMVKKADWIKGKNE